MKPADCPALFGGKPVRDSFLVFGKPAITEIEIQEVVDTLRSGWLGTGPKTKKFEEEFRRYIGCGHAVALNSCTAGLHLALEVAGVDDDDEVITTPMTFAATANAIVQCGARPIFVDVERKTMNIDPARIEVAITPRTKAILPVHMAGRPCQMDAIMEIARRRNLVVIEDAAHATEAFWLNQKIGAIGDLTAFSFYVTKNLCTGEGGMVTTNNDAWADQLRIKSLHGISQDAWKRYSADGAPSYETIYPGYKYNMTDMQASLGIHQLARLEDNLIIREAYVAKYDEAFRDLPELRKPDRPLPPPGRQAHHLYPVFLDLEQLHITRNEFVKAMKAENIGVGIHFTALHLHEYYRQAFGYKAGDFPNAEWIGERTVSLPLSPQLSPADLADVIRAVIRLVEYFRQRS